MARADINVHVMGGNGQSAGHQLNPVEAANGDLYIFFLSGADNQFYYVKSTDSGLSYGDPVIIKTGVLVQFAIWYDRWTPGDSGNGIHVWYTESGVDDVFYRHLDTSSDTLGTEITVFAGGSTGASNNACLSGTKSRGGNLYCLFDIDGGTETGFYRSTDSGANWASRSNTAEGADYYVLVPGFAADNQDIICIFWDRSASEISRKIYDNSADSWAETSIATSMTSISVSTANPQMSFTIDPTNSKIIVVAWTNRDTASARLRVWNVDESAINALTDVVSSSTDDQHLCAISRNSVDGAWVCFYGGKTDGSEVVGTSIHIYYKISLDNGSTWGPELQLTQTAKNYLFLFAPLVFNRDFWATTRSIITIGVLSNSIIIPISARARFTMGLS